MTFNTKARKLPLTIAILFLSTAIFAKNQDNSLQEINKQIEVAEQVGNQSQLFSLLKKKTETLLDESQVDEAIITANQALLISNQIRSESIAESVYNLLSKCYLMKNLVYESLDYQYKGLELSEALKDTLKISQYIIQISRSEEYLERVPYSMSINLKAIKLFTTINDNLRLGEIYRAQGVLHTELGNYKTARNYLSSAIQLLIQNNDSLQLGIAYLNQSKLELQQFDTENAQIRLEKAQQILKKYDEKYQFRCNSLESAILLQNKKTLQATLLLERTAQKQKAINDIKGLSSTLLLLGNAYHSAGNYKNAITSYNHCIKSATSENLTNYVRYSYQGLAKIHGTTLQYKQAYFDLNRYVNITDSLYNLQTIGEANRLENQVTIRTKESEIARQNEQLLINELTLKRERTKQQYLYLLIGMLVIVILVALKEFIQKQKANKVLIQTNDEIKLQKKKLEQYTRNINDSLNYAKRIQGAVLHSTQQPNDFFSDSFMIFQPKELVSGDFYWFKKVGTQILFAVADCTGHGTPGAFMSIIGTFGLNQIVNEFRETRPSEILNHLNDLFSKSIEQREGAEIFDGMDIGICNFDTTTNEIKFAGANIGLNIIRKSSAPAASSVVLHQSEEYTIYQSKFTRQSIGYVLNDRKPYSTQGVRLLPNDCIYLFSDGYTDQFGGPKMKKLGYNKLQSTLCNITELPMQEQKEILLQSFNSWKGENNQIDDVTFLGIRI